MMIRTKWLTMECLVSVGSDQTVCVRARGILLGAHVRRKFGSALGLGNRGMNLSGTDALLWANGAWISSFSFLGLPSPSPRK